MDLNALIGAFAAVAAVVAAPTAAPPSPASAPMADMPGMVMPVTAPPPAPPIPAGPPVVTVKGPRDNAVVTAADLKSMKRYTIKVGWGGGHTFSGAGMTDILATIGAPSEKRLHGPALDQVVIVTGRDGFIAVLAIAETSLTLKKAPVILADEEDGKPLDAKQGPYRLVIGGELKQPRSVWGVVGIELRPIK
jgi:hypothetical protein